MKYALTVALAALFTLPACKGTPKEPENVQQVKSEAPDAKPSLYVSTDDARFVSTPGAGDRQVHYYSPRQDRTYVIDESTGKVVTTYASKPIPRTTVIDTEEIEEAPYQPAPLEEEAEGCGSEEGCAPAEEGCACGCTEGCGCEEGCACGCE